MAKSNGKQLEKGRDARGKFTKDVPNAWKPGQSGNPTGKRSRRKTVTDYLFECLDDVVTIQVDGKPKQITKTEAVARILASSALKINDPKLWKTAITHVLDRVDPVPRGGDVAVNVPIDLTVHSATAVGFIDQVRMASQGGQVTPELVMQQLRISNNGRSAKRNH